jgi:hypothetical protein
MDSDFLSGGYAHKKELDDLEKKLIELKAEFSDEGDSGHGRPAREVEDEIAETEAKIRLFKMPNE